MITGGNGTDRFAFASGDSASASPDTLADFVVADDSFAVGVTGTATNFLIGTAATSYAQALADATSLIGGGSRDIVVITVTGTDAGTYVFADSSANNSVGNAIKITTVRMFEYIKEYWAHAIIETEQATNKAKDEQEELADLL